MLGADLDTPSTDRNPSLIERGGHAAGEAAVGALRSTTESVIPFRGWVRKLTGAERYSREVAAAIAAGSVRRSYLKGVGQARGCAAPAAPVPDVYAVVPTAEGLPRVMVALEALRVGANAIASDINPIPVLLNRVVLELLSDHTELFKQFSDNSNFKRWLTDTVFDATYQRGAVPPKAPPQTRASA